MLHLVATWIGLLRDVPTLYNITPAEPTFARAYTHHVHHNNITKSSRITSIICAFPQYMCIYARRSVDYIYTVLFEAQDVSKTYVVMVKPIHNNMHAIFQSAKLIDLHRTCYNRYCCTCATARYGINGGSAGTMNLTDHRPNMNCFFFVVDLLFTNSCHNINISLNIVDLWCSCVFGIPMH